MTDDLTELDGVGPIALLLGAVLYGVGLLGMRKAVELPVPQIGEE